jgi:hypothetical protein
MRTSIYLQTLLLLTVPSVCRCVEREASLPTAAMRRAFAILPATASGERFYVMVFAAQSKPSLVRYSHCWATMVRVMGSTKGLSPTIECHTISWMPATLVIHPLDLTVERPVNLGLHESLAQALVTGRERISQWGPYECTPELYRRFIAQKAFLESGQIGYQCLDDLGEAALSGNGCNCVHALTDMYRELPRARISLITFGELASRLIVRQLWDRGALIHPEQTHDWLNPILGLDRYPVLHQRVGGGGLRWVLGLYPGPRG